MRRQAHDEEAYSDSKRRRVEGTEPFSSWTWQDVREQFGISAHGLNAFVPPEKDVDDQVLNFVNTVLAAKQRDFGTLSSVSVSVNEATRREFISPLLSCVKQVYTDANLRWFCEGE
jgi:hypothetical protein